MSTWSELPNQYVREERGAAGGDDDNDDGQNKPVGRSWKEAAREGRKVHGMPVVEHGNAC